MIRQAIATSSTARSSEERRPRQKSPPVFGTIRNEAFDRATASFWSWVARRENGRPSFRRKAISPTSEQRVVVAANYSAPSEIRCIGVVGWGTQAELHLQLLKEIAPAGE